MHKIGKKEINISQFGFQQSMGTRKAMYGITILIQRCIDVNKNRFACSLDFTKDLDNVHDEKLFHILKAEHIDLPDIRIILNLFWNQITKIKVNNEISEKI